MHWDQDSSRCRCLPTGMMSGSITGNTVNMTMKGMEHGDTISITGTVSGDSLSGSYTAELSMRCNPDPKDVGTISATLIPSVQGTWTGFHSKFPW